MISFKAIVPKQFDTTKFTANVVKKTLKTLAKQALEDFKITTTNWATPVEFKVDGPRKKGQDWIISIGTNNVIWHWVDAGTKEHEIIARKSKDGMLHFQPTEKLIGTRTYPGSLGSGLIRRRAEWAVVPSVTHPGITARNFSKLVQANLEKVAPQMFTVALNKFTKQLEIGARPAKPPESACFRPGHGC